MLHCILIPANLKHYSSIRLSPSDLDLLLPISPRILHAGLKLSMFCLTAYGTKLQLNM